MKKFIFGLVSGIFLISVLAFTKTAFDQDISMAQVTKEQGFYIFTDCRPVNDYDFITTVKARDLQYAGGTSFTDLTYDQLKANLLRVITRKTRKGKMKKGDAIIINTESASGDLIKFKPVN